MQNYSVLMGIYKKTNVLFLKKSIESMMLQTIPTNDFVIVIDGESSEEIDSLLEQFISEYPNIFNIVRLTKNCGLGIALQEGVKKCRNQLIARMDDDDISYPNRCELQLKEFIDNPSLDLVGGYIDEFSNNENEIIDCRRVPLNQDEMKKTLKKRSPINHVTVMFKKSAVLSSGNYSDYRLCQDVELWARMLYSNCSLINIPVSLVKVRFDENACIRRKNKINIDTMIQIWNNFYKMGYCSRKDLIRVIFLQKTIGMLPLWLIKILYKKTRTKK